MATKLDALRQEYADTLANITNGGDVYWDDAQDLIKRLDEIRIALEEATRLQASAARRRSDYGR